MHELVVAQSMLDMVVDIANQNNASKIISISLRLGKYACINPNSLKFAFSCISREGIAAGAGLCITQVEDDPFEIEVESIEVDD